MRIEERPQRGPTKVKAACQVDKMKRTLTLLFGFVLALGAEAADAAAENYIAFKVLEDLIDSIEPVDELDVPSTSDCVNLVGTARDAMTNTCGDDK